MKIVRLPFIAILMVSITICAIEREKIMDKLVRDKNSFSIAVEALRQGKTIHRSCDMTYYCSREISYEGKKSVEYGYRISDRDFHKGTLFDVNDILANDWIIEENK